MWHGFFFFLLEGMFEHRISLLDNFPDYTCGLKKKYFSPLHFKFFGWIKVFILELILLFKHLQKITTCCWCLKKYINLERFILKSHGFRPLNTFYGLSMESTQPNYCTGPRNLGQKCNIFGFWRISTNFWSMNLNPKSVFGYRVWILHGCQFCIFSGKIYIFNLVFKN